MHRVPFLLLACLCATVAPGQVAQIDDDFESIDPCTSGEWLCQGTAKWVDPSYDLCADSNSAYGCNLYQPGEGYVLLTTGQLNQAGNMFRSEKLLYDAFRLTAEVEIRDGTARPADGMAIVIVGGAIVPGLGYGGGGIGSIFQGTNPEMIFAFDNWGDNPGDQGDQNHVGFAYSGNGFPYVDNVPYQVVKHVDVPLNNLTAGTPNRFQVEVQVKGGVVTCDLGNSDAGLGKSRMYTYVIPGFQPFEGYLGVTASTGAADQNQILHSIRIEDISNVCLFPPADLGRRITNDGRRDRLPVYVQGDTLTVSLSLANIREDSPSDSACRHPIDLIIIETPPAGWTVSDISGGGFFDGAAIRWGVKGDPITPRTYTYRVTATSGDFRAAFAGQMQENIGQAEVFKTGGDPAVILDTPTRSGFITQWLILGPFEQRSYDGPGDIQMQRDYLTDGAGIDEFSVLPEDGDTVATLFNSDSAPVSYRNANHAVPTWESFANANESMLDSIDLNAIYGPAFGGDPDGVMAYAVAYVTNPTGSPMDVNLDAASDDSIEVLLNRCPVLTHSIPRGWGVAEEVQDTAAVTLEPGINRVMAKVFEGGGGWGFRLRFSSMADGTPLEPPALAFSLDPTGLSLPMSSCPVPIISASPVVGKSPLEVRLSGTRSLSRVGQPLVAYAWDFGDGATGSGREVTHTFAAPGSYTVSLSVTDAAGDSPAVPCLRNVHVVAGGIIIQGEDLEALALGGKAGIVTTQDGLKTYYSPPGDDALIADQSQAELALDVASLPAGQDTFTVGVLVRTVGDGDAAFSLTQKTTGIASTLGFDLYTNPPAINAADGALDVDAGALAPGELILRVEDPVLADSYAPFAYAVTSLATLKLAPGLNSFHLDAKVPVAGGAGRPVSDNGDQVAAILIGPEAPDLQGSIKTCPSVPLDLKASPSPCQALVDWSENAGKVDRYIVWRSMSANQPFERVATVTESHYLDTGLTAAKTYFYKVSAGYLDCESVPTSIYKSVKVPAGDCREAPTDLRVTGTSGTVELAWTGVADGSVQGYNVYRSPLAGGPYAKVSPAPLPPGTTTFSDATAPPGVECFYRVTAAYAGAESGSTNIVAATAASPQSGLFRRGDADGSGSMDVTDAIFVLAYLFQGGETPACLDAADADDSGALDLTDAIFVLGYLFQGGITPPAPGPKTCGPDGTPSPKIIKPCVYAQCQ